MKRIWSDTRKRWVCGDDARFNEHEPVVDFYDNDYEYKDTCDEYRDGFQIIRRGD